MEVRLLCMFRDGDMAALASRYFENRSPSTIPCLISLSIQAAEHVRCIEFVQMYLNSVPICITFQIRHKGTAIYKT